MIYQSIPEYLFLKKSTLRMKLYKLRPAQMTRDSYCHRYAFNLIMNEPLALIVQWDVVQWDAVLQLLGSWGFRRFRNNVQIFVNVQIFA